MNLKVDPRIQASRLYSEDLAPVPHASRGWGTWDYAALWVSMSICIPTYMLAGGLLEEGMNWWQALVTILLGNLIVLVPMILNAAAGTKYGIPFPVLLRTSYGTSGAVVAGLLRGLVGCGWFGIQSWIGGSAIYQLMLLILPEVAESPYLGQWMDINAMQLFCFFLFWALNIWIIYRGIHSIRVLERWSAPFLLALGLGLMYWAYKSVGSFGQVLEASQQLSSTQQPFWALFWPGLTAIVGFWATLSLNIPDLTRYAVSQGAQRRGQLLGLPTTMTLFSFVGIFVTSATILLYGEAIWNPVDLLEKFSSPVVMIISIVGLTLATLSTNLAANVVASANDIANLAPKQISFRLGGLITGVIGILVFPWKLLADAHGFIFTWLIGYSGLLGAVAGVMMCDYYLLRKQKLIINDLYSPDGSYGRWHRAGWIATLLPVLLVLPGFLREVNLMPDMAEGSWWNAFYSHSWFVTFLGSFVLYAIFNKVWKGKTARH